MATRGVNKWIGIGTLGADPETRYTAGGQAITSIRIAINETWKDKQTGETKEKVEWIRVKFFGRLAEIAGEYLKKGRQVYVEGKIQTDKYTDKDGVERYSTDIVANEMQMLGGNPEGGSRGGHEGGAHSQQQGGNRPQSQSRPQQQSSQSRPQPAMAGDGFEDDDIPF